MPTGSPRPGPALLYRKLATSPQLENTGPWRAAPIMVSGVRGYRSGEFVYQDFLYDDTALTYPADPAYAGNAADLVEVRLRLLHHSLAMRLTYNSMIDPHLVAASIALGNSRQPYPLPDGAGASSRGSVFVTVHGCSGSAVKASNGDRLGDVRVATDLRRRQVDVRIPYKIYDPRELKSFDVRAAAGLWDVAAHQYLRPDTSKSAFFNVAFREPGAYSGSTWMDKSQNAALANGDISPLVAKVNVAKMRSGRRDDLNGKPGGMPTSGPMNRIYVSHFEPVQGRGNSQGGLVYQPCNAPACTPTYSGRLQPYTVVIPKAPPPRAGYHLTVTLHGWNENHNANDYRTLQMLANSGRPSIVLSPGGRGPGFWWFGLGAADVFEAWADLAAHYRLDPRHVVQSGQSMGGYGAYKLATTYPDLYSAVFPSVGPGAPTLDPAPGSDVATPASEDVWRMFASLRQVPVLSGYSVDDPLVPLSVSMNNMRVLDGLGYRYEFRFFAGASHSDLRYLMLKAYGRLTKRRVDRNPAHVTYVYNPAMSNPGLGMSADHAYWISGLTPAGEATPFATIDAISRASRAGDAGSGTQRISRGVEPGPRPYVQYLRDWETPPHVTPKDELDIKATNLRSMTVNVDRAGLTCRTAVNVSSDVPMQIRLVGRDCDRIIRR